jgi:ABC-2 type transport system ATP-binding protein
MNQEHGTTVILTTHDMQDVEALTQRVMLIGKGKILLDGDLEELKKHSTAHKRLTVEYSGLAPELEENMTLVHRKEGQLEILIDPSVLPVSKAIAILAAQTELTDVSVSGVSAEEMVAQLYKEYNI